MKSNVVLTIGLLINILLISSPTQGQPLKSGIRAYNIDYNWDPKGGYINDFAKPGLWADADPAELMDWYESLGCNAVHSFAVSCNGYAWYKNGFVPEQPGLKYNFLTEMVKIGRKKNMKVFGYFCVGANTKWGLDNPELSYGTPAYPHIPFTTSYIDYLCKSIKDAIEKTDMDGIMFDWVWTPAGYGYNNKYQPLKWLACEQEMFRELMGEPFPGAAKITPEIEQEFRTKSIARLWKQIYETVRSTKANCLVWVTSNNVLSKDQTGTDMFKQADWMMNEAGDIASTEALKNMVGKQTRLITCLAEWNGQDPAVVAPAAINAGVAVYGFTKPIVGFAMPPVEMYLTHPITSFKGDNRNLAVIARAFKGLPNDTVVRRKAK